MKELSPDLFRGLLQLRRNVCLCCQVRKYQFPIIEKPYHQAGLALSLLSDLFPSRRRNRRPEAC